MTSKILIAILLITPQLSLSARSASPVYEVVNEQSRIDEKIRISNSPGTVPYGNPLAGNQNARTHYNNQQAMFKAERVRQLTAQLQKQTRGPKAVDSYMQAYQESQDNHQVALEQQQAVRNPQPISRDRPRQVTQSPVRRNKYEDQSQGTFGAKTPRVESSKKVQRPEPVREIARKMRPDVMRITKADAKDVRARNHRSYGSVDYHQYLEPQKYKTVYLSPAPTYDQGVTIKPNGNIGLAEDTHQSKLLTEAISSNVQYVYPKQYQQMQGYKSIQELQSNVLTNSLQEIPEHYIPSDNTNGAPIDLYFYLKGPSLPENYEQYRYAQLANSYPTGYKTLDAFKDYKPITEEVDDIENPDVKNPKAYTVAKPIPPPVTNQPIQVIPIKQSQQENKQERKPISQSVTYYQPYYEGEKEESKKYLHNDAETNGVQHLTEDGTGVSAYGDENLQYAANYEFGYRVHDEGNDNYFGHSEAKRGESTEGHYHVLLPDGRMQKVRYHAGPGGFHADISYDHVH